MISAADLRARFRDRGFVADEAFATGLEIMLALHKPLLLEGPAGVGKTESAKVLAEALDTHLIRRQCYEGLDAMSALYEWNYPRHMLHARLSFSSSSIAATTCRSPGRDVVAAPATSRSVASVTGTTRRSRRRRVSSTACAQRATA